VRRADDLTALLRVAEDPDIRRLAAAPERVALLWEVCQIPDFRKLLPESHARLIAQIFSAIVSEGRLSDAFLEERMEAIDRVDGDIETLTARIAAVRTWNYVSERRGWTEHAHAWRQRARGAEDRLSDALHERLVQRFVQRHGHSARASRRSRAGSSRQPDTDTTPRPFGAAGPFAKLWQLDLRLSSAAAAPERTIDWIAGLVDDPFEAFTLNEDGVIDYADRPVARLTHGQSSIASSSRPWCMRRLPSHTSPVPRTPATVLSTAASRSRSAPARSPRECRARPDRVSALARRSSSHAVRAASLA
jgi:ATP-dependent RNA helicase SUPV3L1/SUV3